MTERQKRFCYEYLVDLNPTKAAVNAGYSEKYSGQTGCRLLKNPEVQKFLEDLLKNEDKRNEVLVNRVVSELAVIAFSKMEDIKNSEKLKALEMLGKHFRIFVSSFKEENDAGTGHSKEKDDNPFAGLSVEELRKLVENEE
ncbi:MAG: terminase small subunit [Eubacterium sp.]|jgi:phage terminase small subunit|nr:terminase small subunit [Eubacterium sp.]